MTESYILTALERNRKKGGKGSWQHTSASWDRRVKLINYDTIPNRTKVKYNLPEKQYFINQIAEKKANELKLADKLREMDRSYITKEIITNLGDRDWFMTHLSAFRISSSSLADRCIHDYTRVAAWLRWVAEKDKQDIKKYSFTSMPEFYTHVMALIKKEQLHNWEVGNMRTFQRRLKPFKSWLKKNYTTTLRNEVLESVVSGKLGVANHSKMSEWHVHQLIKLAKHGLQLNPVKLHQDMTILATENKKIKVCIETIRLWVNKPEVRERIAEEREGKMKWLNNNMFSITRDKASVPDALWWIDGTPEELWYADEKDSYKLKRVEVIKVLDDYSNKIVGYAAGKENQVTVYNAIKAAVRCKGTIAYQLTSDKGPAMQAIMIKEWFKLLFKSGQGYGHTPTTTGLARAKVIEPMQAIFRQQLLARDKNHSFGNITSKGAQANQDFVKANLKDFPTSKEEVLAQIKRRVEMWNERANNKGEVPNELHDHEYDERRYISEMLYTDLFYLWLPRSQGNSYNKEGLKITFVGKTHQYIAPCAINAESSEEDCKKVAVFLNENAGRKFIVKIDPDDLSKVALYFNGNFHSFAYAKENTKRALFDTTTYDGKLLDRYKLVQHLQHDDNKSRSEENDYYIEANSMAKEPFSTARIHKNDRNDASTVIKSIKISEDKLAELELTNNSKIKRKNKWA